jgi:hypothetical protein
VLRYTSRCFHESPPQPSHLIGELFAQSVGISDACEMLDMIGNGPDNGHLRAKPRESELASQLAVVIGFEGSQGGEVRKHRLPQAIAEPCPIRRVRVAGGLAATQTMRRP